MKYFVIGGISSAADDAALPAERLRLTRVCGLLGASFSGSGNTIVVCSPFEGSADHAILTGIGKCIEPQRPTVELHFVDSEEVRLKIDELMQELGLKRVVRIPYTISRTETKESRSFAWLLCQLNALDSANVTIAIGGQPEGAANMLLLLAEGRRKPLLPFPFMGGAAKRAFDRRRYELEDRLGDQFDLLQEEESIGNTVELANRMILFGRQFRASKIKGDPTRFFISYPRGRQAEADFVETLLRRRNLPVFRDEHDFGAGASVLGAIREALFSCDVVIIIWCAEYACSPWCFDEFELALDRAATGNVKLWILCTDGTRMVPKRARDLIFYDTRTRAELEGRISDLMATEI